MIKNNKRIDDYYNVDDRIIELHVNNRLFGISLYITFD